MESLRLPHEALGSPGSNSSAAKRPVVIWLGSKPSLGEEAIEQARSACRPMQHDEQGTVGTHEEASIFHDRTHNGPGRVGQGLLDLGGETVS